ncbi:uncharacterized protein LOC112639654 isoform X3 [Camponotus floridanus]|uniref:uncharacterized protein LOC112639654 isoform X3 n=1 Tax=Camponotus floridanus TaxID=104421 RepID=UPI000DC693F0|nr:uncharacterized protein LOC112639654 isoform X3 [Camponotus floridanus]
MIGFVAQNFELNRILLLIVGLWPLQQSNLTRLQFIFMSAFMTADIIFIMKDLLIQLQDVCNELKDKNEIAIMKEYGYIASCYTTAFTTTVCGLFGYILMIFWPDIMHIILPNVTQSHQLPFKMEYFIDQEKYFYWIALYVVVATCIGMTSMIGIGSILIMYLQCTCGMFRISRYRIRCAVHINMLENIKSRKDILILEGIISAINIHQQAMKLSKLLTSEIETMMCCLIVLGVISLSLNLFQVSRVVSYGYDIKELLIPFAFIAIGILYMFISNYVTQNVTDHNNDIFATVYDVQWHVTPLHIQKVILFLLQRGTKDFTLSVCGLFVGSLECFTMLMKTSFSYFTVIYSTQE